MPKKQKKVRMVKGDSVVNPLADAIPVWEKAGYKVTPNETPNGETEIAQTEE